MVVVVVDELGVEEGWVDERPGVDECVVDVWAVVEEARVDEWAGGRVGATVVDGTEVAVGATVVGGTEVVVTAAAGSVVTSDPGVDVRHTAATSCRLRDPPDGVVGMAGKTKCGFRSEIAPDDTTSDPPMPPTSIAAIAIATTIPPLIPSRRALRCSGLRW